jgi:signal transduction histidine kinase
MKRSHAFAGLACFVYFAGFGAASPLPSQPSALFAPLFDPFMPGGLVVAGLLLALLLWHASRSARRLAQARLQHQLALRLAARAIHTKHQFLRLVDCELCSPMQAIAVAAESLARDNSVIPARPKQAVAIRRIQRAVVALQSQLRDLLTLALVEEGSAGDGGQMGRADQHADAWMSFDANAWLRDVCAKYEDAAQAKGLSLESSTLAEPQHIHGDTIRLGQVLRNLLNHAVCRTVQGRVEVTLGTVPSPLSAGSAGQALLRFTVSDTGLRLQADELACLTAGGAAPGPFERDTHAAHRNLLVVRDVLQQLGGTVTVHTTAGPGTTFEVEVPVSLLV